MSRLKLSSENFFSVTENVHFHQCKGGVLPEYESEQFFIYISLQEPSKKTPNDVLCVIIY